VCADRRLYLGRRPDRLFDQVRVACRGVRWTRADRSGDRPADRRELDVVARGKGRSGRRGLHRPGNANRRQGRRGKVVAHRSGRRRYRGEHAGARRVRGCARAAQGDTMRRLTQLILSMVVMLIGVASARAATSEVADAAMRGDRAGVRAAIARAADVNAAQVDGTTALHWAAERDDVEMAELLIGAGAHVSARTREGVTPLQLAATNGSALMIGRLIRAGADPNAALTPAGDT